MTAMGMALADVVAILIGGNETEAERQASSAN